MIFTGPDSTTARENGCAWLSYDGGATWPVKQQIYAGAFAYSVPVTLDRNKFGVLFERDGYKRISLAIVDFAWFCSGKDEMSMMKDPN
jgi:sialidase-1